LLNIITVLVLIVVGKGTLKMGMQYQAVSRLQMMS
jgi:hypothetical protein